MDDTDCSIKKSTLDLIMELERSTSPQETARRAHTRTEVRSSVTLESCNYSERTVPPHRGVTGDVSSGGCLLLLEEPLNVGNIYEITWDRTHVDSPAVLGRCVRCRYIRSDAFEAGFQFFAPLEASCLEPDDAGDSLI